MEQFPEWRAQAAKLIQLEEDCERRIREVEEDCERIIREVEDDCETRIQEALCRRPDIPGGKLIQGIQDAGCNATKSQSGNLPSLTLLSQSDTAKRGIVAISDATVGECRSDRSIDCSKKPVVADSTAGSETDSDNEAIQDNSDAPTDDMYDDNVNKHRGEADAALKKRKIGSWGGLGHSDK